MKIRFFLKVLLIILTLMVICILLFPILNRINDSYEDLSESDKVVLSETDRYCQKDSKSEIWPGLDFEKKTVLAVNGTFGSAYLINPQKEVNNLFAHKIEMPEGFSINVYRVTPAFPGLFKYRLGGKFNIFDKTYIFLDNEVYFLRYDDEMTSSEECNSMHFITLLSHESFHYLMQKLWPSYGRFETEDLTKDDLDLMHEQYKVLSAIQRELKEGVPDRQKLLNLAAEYVEAVDKRIENNPEYMEKELSEETGEGSATYVSIKASEAVGYKYGNMLFKNNEGELVELPFDSIVPAIKSEEVSKSAIATNLVYESGSLLCLFMDALDVPEWKEQLNLQTEKDPVSLYSILKDYVKGN